MHEFFVNIGYAILNFFRNVKTDNILKSLSIMGIGMVGIFLVTGIIVLAVYLLNKISNSDGKTKNKKNLSQVLDKILKVGIIERVDKLKVRWSRG